MIQLFKSYKKEVNLFIMCNKMFTNIYCAVHYLSDNINIKVCNKHKYIQITLHGTVHSLTFTESKSTSFDVHYCTLCMCIAWSDGARFELNEPAKNNVHRWTGQTIAKDTPTPAGERRVCICRRDLHDGG